MSERQQDTQAPEDALEEPESEPDSVRPTEDAQDLEEVVDEELADTSPAGE